MSREIITSHFLRRTARRSEKREQRRLFRENPSMSVYEAHQAIRVVPASRGPHRWWVTKEER